MDTHLLKLFGVMNGRQGYFFFGYAFTFRDHIISVVSGTIMPKLLPLIFSETATVHQQRIPCLSLSLLLKNNQSINEHRRSIYLLRNGACVPWALQETKGYRKIR